MRKILVVLIALSLTSCEAYRQSASRGHYEKGFVSHSHYYDNRWSLTH
jgi:hypothetical protein